jgi:spermidine synthase
MGLAFPLATRLLLSEPNRIGRGVGRAVAWSNVGGVLGAASTALVLLPMLGTIGATQALAGLNLALGILVLARLHGSVPLRSVAACIAILTIAALGLTLPARLPFRGEARTAFGEERLVFEEEGDVATVQVWESRTRVGVRAMAIDGVIIAVNRGWFYPIYSKQKLLAHLPMLLDASITRTLNIGLGSGSTVHALAGYPSVEHLDVVEISEGVVRGSALFPESEVLTDSRARIVVEDAVHFLLRGRDTYDLIIADGKQHPEFSHNWTTMTREFYAAARARLDPEGLFVQWLPLSTLADDFVVALRTFSGVFPEVEIFLDAPHWIVMVGSRAPVLGRRGWTPAQLKRLPASADLRGFGFRSGKALLATWVANRSMLETSIGAGEISTWNRTRLEFSSYRTDAAAKARAPRENLALLIRAGELAREIGAAPLAVDAEGLQLNLWLRRAHLAELDGDREGARSFVRRALKTDAEDPRARALRGTLETPSQRSSPRQTRPSLTQ